MKKISKTAIVGVISLVSLVVTVGLAGAATYSNGSHSFNKSGFLAKGGSDKIGSRGFMDMTIVAKDLGLTLTDLTTELKSGKSINDIATDKKVDTVTLTTDLQSAASIKIDEAVQAGKLTADQATTVKANISTRVQALLSRKGLGPLKNTDIDRKGGIGFGGSKPFMDIVVKDLSMPLTDLTTELRSGKSINEIAAEKSIATTTLTTDLQSEASTKIDEAVQAGKLTADQATTAKANISTRVQNFLSSKGHKPMSKLRQKASSFKATNNSPTQTNLQ